MQYAHKVLAIFLCLYVIQRDQVGVPKSQICQKIGLLLNQ